MSEPFQVSVVIPVYNARDFVTDALESALQQPETCEILLIEDGSLDGGLEVCQRLAQQHCRVKLLRHFDEGNHGAAASRNLGIRSATFPYIAFLDADDFFLPNRFAETKRVFCLNENADGVYEAIGVTFEDPESRDLYNEVGLPHITTVKGAISPENLFVALMKGGMGHFSFNGFTGKKDLFTRVSRFDERLAMYEDSLLMFQLSAKGRLYPGNIKEPVALRRVHRENRITNRLKQQRINYDAMVEFWQLLLIWGKVNLSARQLYWLVRRNVSQIRNIDYLKDICFSDFVTSRKRMLHYVKDYPFLLFDSYFWRRLLPSRSVFASRRFWYSIA
jgi:glycosyltransferase involved in cell wall biosynthesis